ncbi:EscU/YscU/HrcU family type III secretion system export apparatus switch protein [Salinivibrio sp. ES.052]|uniref:EscU/YscU/HrcU family type III secretion system export apparatus switch protein n=1 Tax=Salinivibrio sp. ES.052 TaxID=1882823 RepID=UPI00092BFA87|nr:EscU/YscU/HrcU family type III secretion system export apparatus switch protein [Salinivibrio sp. ES.052]SIN75945.1 flagellar biosynthesis protein [Salinivibrio sp. ES.052]
MKDEKRAMALGYDGYNTPTVKAKATDRLAHELINALSEQGCLIHEDAYLLAWLERLETGDEIPPILYQVIAELIAYAWVLEGKTPPGWQGHKSIDTQV